MPGQDENKGADSRPGILEKGRDIFQMPDGIAHQVQAFDSDDLPDQEADQQGANQVQQRLKKPAGGNLPLLESDGAQDAQGQFLLLQIVPAGIHNNKNPDNAAQRDQHPHIQIICTEQVVVPFLHD